MRWGSLRVLGGMPNALALQGTTLYVADGGDNALAEMDLTEGRVRGFRHAGYFPTAVSLSRNGKTAFVLNTKGNGSVQRTTLGKPGNAHDFQGTVTVVDLSSDLDRETEIVAREQPMERQSRAAGVESLQRRDQARPVHHQGESHLRRDLWRLTAWATATRSFAAWARQSCRTIASWPASSRCSTTAMSAGRIAPMGTPGRPSAWPTITSSTSTSAIRGPIRTTAIVRCRSPTGGALWDAALKKGRSVRVWGEFCDDKLATIRTHAEGLVRVVGGSR